MVTLAAPRTRREGHQTSPSQLAPPRSIIVTGWHCSFWSQCTELPKGVMCDSWATVVCFLVQMGATSGYVYYFAVVFCVFMNHLEEMCGQVIMGMGWCYLVMWFGEWWCFCSSSFLTTSVNTITTTRSPSQSPLLSTPPYLRHQYDTTPITPIFIPPSHIHHHHHISFTKTIPLRQCPYSPHPPEFITIPLSPSLI